MRSSPPCSAGDAGAPGYLENINDSKQPEELPGEYDASQSTSRNQYICVCIKIHKTVMTSHLLPGHRAGWPAAWSKTRAMGFENRPTRLTDSICSDQNGFTWMDASLKRITGLSLRKKGAVRRNPMDSGADWILMRVLCCMCLMIQMCRNTGINYSCRMPWLGEVTIIFWYYIYISWACRERMQWAACVLLVKHFCEGDAEGHADRCKVLSWNILPGFRLPTHNSHKKQISHWKLFLKWKLIHAARFAG